MVVRLKGEKVNLCTVDTSDSSILKYTEWINNEDFNHYISNNNRVRTYQYEKEWAENFKEQIAFNIVAKDKCASKLIGNCSINMKNRNANMGIMIGDTDFHGKGFGTETMQMLVKFAFEELNAHRCKLTLLGSNERAHRCYEKAGFVDCGREHETNFVHGKWEDLIHMEILEDDYWKKAKR